ncbi:MAG: 2-hydroxychromene-2-carboxylate isomerase [Alphaproteobacteria bacterium]|nr:2-hydroxychromene-2-carboxylate isomerase [Alphaproteobacteria bacterium]
MSAPVIDYFYSTRSAFAYLGAARFTALARRFGRRIVHKPVNLAAVLAGTGGQQFGDRPQARRDYFFGREIERWGEFLDIPVRVEPKHHFGDRAAPSGYVIAAQRLGADVDALSQAILAALWRDDRDIGNLDELDRVAAEAGIDPQPIRSIALSAEIQAEFAANDAEAIRLNVFGSPTYIVDGDPFYGQDRLALVERALERPFHRRSN